jgi:molybdate transport system substrate-binding protein
MAKLRVMSAGAMEGPVHALTPEFERASGHQVELIFNTVGALRTRFVGGDSPDVIILSSQVIEALEKESRFVPGSSAQLGKATCGVAVRDGMLMPNISTVENFRKMLGFAGSIACNDPAHGGSSGIYLADLLKRWGIYDQLKPKMVLCKTGRECALSLVEGRAEIGITFTSEFIPVEGTRVVGPLPKEIEYVNGYAAAIPAGADAAAKDFMAFLTSPASRVRFRDFGLE